MCGIAGYWAPTPPAEGHEPILDAMNEAMRRRGPDDCGRYADPDGGPAFAHVRLAIIDLSPAGAQPMHSACGRLTVAFNGEIYNYADIRAELDAMGEAPPQGWRGHSDTEVLLEAFRVFGVEDTISRCIGMFALALWDRRDRSLTLVRDRLGIKPLHYGFAGATLLFGSEFKPLRKHPEWTGAIDVDALALYLRTLYVPDPFTIHAGFRKLEQGSIVRFTEKDLASRAMPAPTRYWSVNECVDRGLAAPFTGTDSEAADALEELLTDAVRLRTVADVPLGSFLSGGIDSSTVTALLQKISDRPVKTFTIGYQESEYDEAAHAETVARHLGTDHTTLRLTPDETLAVIPDLPTFYDEPFADASQIPTFLVSQLAREQVTVCLSGDGGDELFGGYNRYLKAPATWNKVRLLPMWMRNALVPVLDGPLGGTFSAVYDTISRVTNPKNRQLIFRDKLQKVAASMSVSTREEFFENLTAYWISPERFVRGASRPATHFSTPASWPAFEDFERWMMAMDMRTYIPGDALHKVDRASMAVALEARVPLLDHHVAEFALTLPLNMKIRNGRGKWLLREVLHRHVPQSVFDRPKQGFGIPIDEWLRGPLRDWAESLLSEKRLREEGFFDPAPIRKALADHIAGRANRQYHLWGVLMFQAWHEVSRS